jgi:uncharacterized membrane protein
MSEMPPSSVPPSSYNPPPPSGSSLPPGSSGASDRSVMLALSYLFFLGIIPLLMKKDDRDIQWHAKNGLFMFIAYFVLSLVIGFVFRRLPIPCGALAIHCTLWLAYLAVMIFAIMKAMKGERLRFPVISNMADK